MAYLKHRYLRLFLSLNPTTATISALMAAIVLLGVWTVSKNFFHDTAQHQFNLKVLENTDRIQKRLSQYESILHSGAAFYQSSNYITRDEWKRYIRTLDVQRDYPGVQGVGFVEVVASKESEALVQRMRQEGFHEFSIRSNQTAKMYAPVLYLEPMDNRNYEAIGYDILSESNRRQAIEHARDTGTTVITKKIQLVQEIDKDKQPGILMMLPLYKADTKIDTTEQRREAFIGLIDSAFRMTDLMQHIVSKEATLNFEIYDSDKMTEDHLLYRSFKPSLFNPQFHVTKVLTLYGQRWYLNFWSTPEFENEQNHGYPLLFTAIGLTIYFGLLILILYLIQAKKSADEKELFLKKSQRAAGIGSYSLDLKTMQWESSETLNDIFGIDADYNRTLQGWIDLIHPQERESIQQYFLEEVVGQHQPFNREYRIIRPKDQAIQWLHGLGKLQFNHAGVPTKMVGTIQDITAKKHEEEQINQLVYFDQLTGLPNRIMLDDRFKFILNQAQRKGENFAVMFLDLDDFKNVNDTLGHSVGDKLLIEIAHRLKQSIRDEDTVARLGGDEFVLIFPHTDVSIAVGIADKLIAQVSMPVFIAVHDLNITPSIGIALYPDDGKEFETLLKHADTAMYRVKKESRNNYSFFTEEMQKNLSRNLMLTNALRHAIENHQLEVYYQPQVNIEDGNIIGAEALLRWNHPELGMISPSEFIPLAESSGQIIAIGEWVLRTAIRQTKEWMKIGFSEMVIAVNLSAVQFRQTNLPDIVITILNEIGLPHECLELELTEAVTMNDPVAAIDVMNTLHKTGIRMSIDDFGTGYSSLSYLKRFKIYKLKIDQSFVRDIATDVDDRSIVSAIIDMANNLGLHTIAEGVETAEQLNILRKEGCNEIQGYYFSKPLPADQFLTLFEQSDNRLWSSV